MAKHAPGRKFLIAAAVLYLLAAIMFYKGYDKMTNYRNSSYSSLNENAYVGGDAYNYIINGTYATGFFVLGSGFLLTGTVCVSTHFLGEQLNDITKDRRKWAEIDSGTVDADELPDL